MLCIKQPSSMQILKDKIFFPVTKSCFPSLPCMFQCKPIPITQNHSGMNNLGHAWSVHNLYNNHNSATDNSVVCFTCCGQSEINTWNQHYQQPVPDLNLAKFHLWKYDELRTFTPLQIICINFSTTNNLYVYMYAKWRNISTLWTEHKDLFLHESLP